jgi:hypothetical protein
VALAVVDPGAQGRIATTLRRPIAATSEDSWGEIEPAQTPAPGTLATVSPFNHYVQVAAVDKLWKRLRAPTCRGLPHLTEATENRLVAIFGLDKAERTLIYAACWGSVGLAGVQCVRLSAVASGDVWH